MRNHIVLKFIAIVLCAAALLGAVGCGTGITLLTGFNLYDRTVEEMYRDQANSFGQVLAEYVAMRYSDMTLGGMPQEYLQQNGVTRYYDPAYVTYELLDTEGNLLTTEDYLTDAAVGPAPEGATTFTFQVAEGKYRHLVSAIPLSQEPAVTEPESLEPTVDPGTISLEAPPTVAATAPAEEPLMNGVLGAGEAAPAAEPAPDGEGADLSEDPEIRKHEAQSDEEPAEEAATEETAAEETTAEETAADETVAEDTAAEETTADETAADETAADETDGEETDGQEPLSEDEPEDPDTGDTQPQEEPQQTEPAQPAQAGASAQLSLPPVEEPVLINGKPLSEYQVYTGDYFDFNRDSDVKVTYVLLDSPAYTVRVHLLPGAMDMDRFLPALSLLRSCRNVLIPGLAVCLLLFAALAVYLCCAAGRAPSSQEVRAAGLNRLPLELYALAVIGSGAFLVMFSSHEFGMLLGQNLMVGLAVEGALAYLVCLFFVGFCFAVAAQVKTPGAFWLRNSLCGWALRLAGWAWHQLLKSILWLANLLEKKILPFLGRVILTLCRGIRTVCVRVFATVQRFMDLLPLTWQWLVVCFGLLLLFLIGIAAGSVLLVLLAVFASLAAVLYGSQAFGVLLESTRRMSKGDLHVKIDDKLLFGCFRDFAKILNDLANVAMVAAQKQLKSERMKTELITNVSHDIKTPLTSIISYADLLQKPHTPEEEQQYLEVLSRQSMQLKKLIEDLIEMSKASTGNLSVDITQVDAVEAMNQALGEFADKLEAAMLTPVFRHSDPSAPMMADGKLVWRVLHNLLSNAVKYALPGTRLYIDMLCLEGKVILSMKNVSRDQLNVDAEELMERFVRGDGSRNTEGSGLGLNIAKSMMELQHGSLQLLVDGDLFKVTLIFPGA